MLHSSRFFAQMASRSIGLFPSFVKGQMLNWFFYALVNTIANQSIKCFPNEAIFNESVGLSKTDFFEAFIDLAKKASSVSRFDFERKLTNVFFSKAFQSSQSSSLRWKVSAISFWWRLLCLTAFKVSKGLASDTNCSFTFIIIGHSPIHL